MIACDGLTVHVCRYGLLLLDSKAVIVSYLMLGY